MIEGTVRMRFLEYEWLPAADTNAASLSITAQHPDATVVDARLSTETLRALAEAEESRIARHNAFSHIADTDSRFGGEHGDDEEEEGRLVSVDPQPFTPAPRCPRLRRPPHPAVGCRMRRELRGRPRGRGR
jgi:hypothetical protein